MGQMFLYYVTYIHQSDGKVGFGAKFYRNTGPLNSVEEVQAMVTSLTREEIQGEPDAGTLPIVPLTWTLIRAQRGPAVKARRKRSAPGDNGSGPTTVGEPTGQ